MEQQQSAMRTALTCTCPRCGKGKLFAGFLTLRPRCEACGLDYAFADSGDGPAVFIILLAGLVVVFAALGSGVRVSAALLAACAAVGTAHPSGDDPAVAADKGADGRSAIQAQGARRARRIQQARMTAAGRASRSSERRGLLIPSIMAVAGFAILIGLGLWQLERKVWKESLIATVTERAAAAPAELPPQASWSKLDPAEFEFRRVRLRVDYPPECTSRRGSISAAPPCATTSSRPAISSSRRHGFRAGAWSSSIAATFRTAMSRLHPDRARSWAICDGRRSRAGSSPRMIRRAISGSCATPP